MLFADHPVVVRGGGDIGTGAVARLHRCGFPVTVLELPRPLTVRRTVAVSSAVVDGQIEVEDVAASLVAGPADAASTTAAGRVAVLVSPTLSFLEPAVVVDARLAKRNIDTTIADAPFVVGLGPGFTAGSDCHAVIETMRGPDLGRVIWEGPAAPDTGEPGSVGGESTDRVLRAPRTGMVEWRVAIGDLVERGQSLGRIEAAEITATTSGVVRGLLRDGYLAEHGLKIGDIDPRGDPAACHRISDKALAIGGGVLEAVLSWINRSHG